MRGMLVSGSFLGTSWLEKRSRRIPKSENSKLNLVDIQKLKHHQGNQAQHPSARSGGVFSPASPGIPSGNQRVYSTQGTRLLRRIAVDDLPVRHHEYMSEVGSEESLRSFTVRQEVSVSTNQDIILAFRKRTRVLHSLAGRRSSPRLIVAGVSHLGPKKTSKIFSDIQKGPPIRERAISIIRSRRTKLAFVVLALGLIGFGAISFVMHGLRIKGDVLGMSTEGVDRLQAAVVSMKQKDFDGSGMNFEYAATSFADASAKIEELNGSIVELTRFIPGASKLASGKYLVSAGEHIALAGKSLNRAVSEAWDTRENPEGAPVLAIFQSAKKSVEEALGEMRLAEEDLGRVDASDVPEEKRAQFVELKEKLPKVIGLMELFLDHSVVLHELLGGNGPRKYLFLFQNNQEARATGGFIGTYGLLDITPEGRVRKLLIDGIFNPDGQFSQNIVPPEPLQKATGGWTLHDSNWFPDFPTSARKAIIFYEKTGGPTVDGVITLTPVVIQKLLETTGPVTLDEYGVTLDSDNFMALVQDQVEFKYDKELNKPKQILADLAPVLLDRVAGVSNEAEARKILGVMEESLREKHILLYSQNENIQKMIQAAGWSGEIIQSSGDYLSVINTNISGYKTDGVIDETIEHEARIGNDGSVVDTVTITRRHNGGNTPYDFWNRVNADYMRVYVPKGSQLLSAQGQTRETVKPPLDYDALHFVRDSDVLDEEKGVVIDEESGTRIYTQADKTVFANWVYVSPQETVTVKYSYRLPFLVRPLVEDSPSAGSYSIIFQKQSGSVGSRLKSILLYPEQFTSLWQTPNSLVRHGSGVRLETELRSDSFYGIVLGR